MKENNLAICGWIQRLWRHAKLKIVALTRFWLWRCQWKRKEELLRSHAEDLTTLNCLALHIVTVEMYIRHKHNDKAWLRLSMTMWCLLIPAAFRYIFPLLILGKLFQNSYVWFWFSTNFGCNVTSHFSLHYFKILYCIFKV